MYTRLAVDVRDYKDSSRKEFEKKNYLEDNLILKRFNLSTVNFLTIPNTSRRAKYFLEIFDVFPFCERSKFPGITIYRPISIFISKSFLYKN